MNRTLKRKYGASFRNVMNRMLVGVIAVLLLVGSFAVLRLVRITGLSPIVVYRLISGKEEMVLSGKRTNVLLLGVGGGDHDGSDLTDTMMVLSINQLNRNISFISLPRDIWSETIKDKINAAYHSGEVKKKGGGLTLSKVIAEDVTGLTIAHSIKIDFAGFKKLIDLVGGVDVNVPTAFTDTTYPIPGKEHDSCPGDPLNRCVYETVHFDTGLQHMDGDRALVYVRSRHAAGSEGNDFSRNRRQQEIIIALKNKMLHLSDWMTFDRIRRFIALYHEAIETDMKPSELIAVGREVVSVRDESIGKIPIADNFIQPPEYLYGGAFVLVPETSWAEVHANIVRALR